MWLTLRVGVAGAHGVEHEQNAADDDAGVGHVEVGPVVVDDVDFEEVGDHAVAQAVPHIADGAAEDEREGQRGCGEMAADAQQDDEDGESGDNRKPGEQVVGGRGVRRIGEERKGRAGIADVREAEDVVPDGNGGVFGNVADDPGLGEAVGEDDESGDGEEDGSAVGGFHRVVSYQL